MDDDKVEALASSFYAVEYNSHSWNSAPELIKDEFRLYARSAIELFSEQTDKSDDLMAFSSHVLPNKMYFH